MIISRNLKILWLCLLILPWGANSPRAQEPTQEYQLKLAFMVNFARFITWPEESFTPANPQLALCVLGDNPFGSALSGVEGKKVGDRTLNVQQMEALGQEQQCHLLFVSRSAVGSLATLEPVLGSRPMVTISDIPGFAAAGGGIEFVLKDNRLSFIINNSVMKDRGVQASSSLLNLAASIR